MACMNKYAIRYLEGVIFRKDYIVERCINKSVLHLGFIQHSHLYKQKIAENDWLHAKIGRVASRLVGIDYLTKTVDEIEDEYGYDVYAGDVMELSTVPLEEYFDVIVCGELIEHIENPGLFLDGVKRFCHKDTEIILTTPNPWSNSRIQLIQSGVLEDQWLNPEHTMWFSFQTMNQLLDRKGYSCILSDYYYAQNKQDIFNQAKGLLGNLRLIKRIVKLRRTPKHQYDGLFFVVSPILESPKQ